jgi:hypothetical protein
MIKGVYERRKIKFGYQIVCQNRKNMIVFDIKNIFV